MGRFVLNTGATLSARLAGRANWRARLAQPVPALPVDLFRILAGVTAFFYFVWTLSESEDISNPDGLVDHHLSRRIFWYTKASLFFPGLGLCVFRTIYLSAVAAAGLLVAGYRTRLTAAYLFLVAVSTYRWNFMVINVEDSIMHLVLFWLALLPTGRTLTLQGWLARKKGADTSWRQAMVPGTTVRAFLANISLVYLVAGLWKFTSPLWRQGLALYASLKTPVSRVPHYWNKRHLPFLVAGNYISLLLEPLVPLVYVLPTGHALKWGLGLGAVGLHLGIIAALKVPFANLACLAVLALAFRQEMMALLPGEAPPPAQTPEPIDGAGRVGLFTVVTIALAMLWEVRHPEWRTSAFRPEGVLYRLAQRLGLNPRFGHHQNPMYAVLWLMGLAQSYRLVDWIDIRNYYIVYDAVARSPAGDERAIEPRAILPHTLRGALLSSYLHGLCWLDVAPEQLVALQRSLFQRLAVRYCRRYPQDGVVELRATVQRTHRGNLALDQGETVILLRFACRQGEAELLQMRLTATELPASSVGQGKVGSSTSMPPGKEP